MFQREIETPIGFDTHKDSGVKYGNRSRVVLLDLPPWKGVIMLILSRRLGEKLIIGEDVTVTILGVKGCQVRIGIEAPSDVRVNREEIYKRILKERATLGGTRVARLPTPKNTLSVKS